MQLPILFHPISTPSTRVTSPPLPRKEKIQGLLLKKFIIGARLIGTSASNDPAAKHCIGASNESA
jgi:hypothetical protein